MRAFFDRLVQWLRGESQCPSCGSREVSERLEETTLSYGIGDALVELPMELLVVHCASCGESFTDHRGEAMREAVVQRYLATKNNRV